VRLLEEVLQAGPILFSGVPAIASWTASDFARFQRTIRTFFRQLIDVAESGQDEAVLVPELVVEQLRFGVTTVRDDVALTVEGHGAVDVLLFQILNLVQRVGLSRLRRCPCGRVFAKTGRREFCSNRCQKRIYMRALREEERRERERKRHDKTTRTRRR
jgi:hypothetical protein